MKTEDIYKTFEHDKSSDELLYNTSLWEADLSFVKTETLFIQNIIKHFPFKSKVPNLYEQLQLFMQELTIAKTDSSNLIDKIYMHNNELHGISECEDISCDNYYMVEYEKLAKDVFKFLNYYKHLKLNIYQYINGIIKNE